MPSVLSPLIRSWKWPLLALLVFRPCVASASEGDNVFQQTAHGSRATGVDRDSAWQRGTCRQCHSAHGSVVPAGASVTSPYGLFAPVDNTLCFDCHSGAGTAGIFLGQAAYTTADHWLSGRMLWPGPVPSARGAGDEGLCINCHTPHGAVDGQGLVPALKYVREEAQCLACHDADGPASYNLAAEVDKSAAHPVRAASGVHVFDEGFDSTAYAVGRRHAECTDCHNPHAAFSGAPLAGVLSVQPVYGVGGTVPAYIERGGAAIPAATESEVCFKCHSSWTTLPVGSGDLALELNPANASFHPIAGAGTNTTTAMGLSLAGGTGLPHLGVGSTVTCSDCHGSEALPLSVSTVATYVGTVPRGPHGSNARVSNSLSKAVLRASYRVTLKSAVASYRRADFTLCYICHDSAPFEDDSKDDRADTNFSLHGYHLMKIDGSGDFDGTITTPGAGRGNSLCKECHWSLHGSPGAHYAQDRNNARLVTFSPNITGPDGVGAPRWQAGSCWLECHGKKHDSKSY